MIAHRLVVATCFVWCAISAVSSANAGVLAFDFVHEGFTEDAFISGTFVGEDLNGDGFLSFQTDIGPPFDELTSFSIEFSGNSLVPAFSFNSSLPDSFGALLYDFGGGPRLGNDTEVIGQLAEFALFADNLEAPTYIYGTGRDVLGDYPLGISLAVDGDLQFSDLSTEVAFVTPASVVPEPASLATWGILIATCGVRRRRANARPTRNT